MHIHSHMRNCLNFQKKTLQYVKVEVLDILYHSTQSKVVIDHTILHSHNNATIPKHGRDSTSLCQSGKINLLQNLSVSLSHIKPCSPAPLLATIIPTLHDFYDQHVKYKLGQARHCILCTVFWTLRKRTSIYHHLQKLRIPRWVKATVL